MSIYQRLIANKKTIICLGAGGVGKTTMATAIALVAAKEGKKVGLLSIDPAKRLAAALGISLGSELKKINLPAHLVKGEVWAAMLDQKIVFDELVRRYTKSPAAQEQILNHPLYQAASSGFGGALEYMALAKLQRMVDSDEYDLVVLDTPPDSHALDFLSRPTVLSGFMDSRVMSWLIKPIALAKKVGFGKLMSMGERLAGGLASVTGIKALQILAEFLILMQGVIEGLHNAGSRITEILRGDSTGFVLVTTLRSSPLRSAINMIKELRERGFGLDYVIVNRCLPQSVAQSIAQFNVTSAIGASKNWLQVLHNSYTVSEKLKKKLNDSLIKELGHAPPVQTFPEWKDALHEIDSMMELAKALNS